MKAKKTRIAMPLLDLNKIPRIAKSRMCLNLGTQEEPFSYLTQFEDGNYNLVLPKNTYPELFNIQCSNIAMNALRGWQPTRNKNLKQLWLSKDIIGDEEEQQIQNWLKRCAQFVLLGINEHIEEYFTDELDYCMAASFNAYSENDRFYRTDLGEAEYQVKYGIKDKKNFDILVEALSEAFEYLPLQNRKPSLCIIPSEPGLRKLSRRLVREVSQLKGIPFIDATLDCSKKKLKNLQIDEKIPEWDRIYSDNKNVIFSDSVSGKTIVIIDDLYQSGVSMWSMAKHLKLLGAESVMGLVCVKSMRDTDNR